MEDLYDNSLSLGEKVLYFSLGVITCCISVSIVKRLYKVTKKRKIYGAYR